MLESEIAQIQARLLDKRFSLSALASALLQIGKQGISVVRRNPANCPDGRFVCGVPLKWAIWAGRNQALHYEEPRKISAQTQDYLQQMAQNGGNPILFDSRAEANISLAVVEELGWLLTQARAFFLCGSTPDDHRRSVHGRPAAGRYKEKRSKLNCKIYAVSTGSSM